MLRWQRLIYYGTLESLAWSTMKTMLVFNCGLSSKVTSPFLVYKKQCIKIHLLSKKINDINISDQIKGTAVNLILPSLHGGPVEITFTISLKVIWRINNWISFWATKYNSNLNPWKKNLSKNLFYLNPNYIPSSWIFEHTG